MLIALKNKNSYEFQEIQVNNFQKVPSIHNFACRYFFRLNMHGCPSEIQSDNIVDTMPYVICIYWTNSMGVSDIRPCEKIDY